MPQIDSIPGWPDDESAFNGVERTLWEAYDDPIAPASHDYIVRCLQKVLRSLEVTRVPPSDRMLEVFLHKRNALENDSAGFDLVRYELRSFEDAASMELPPSPEDLPDWERLAVREGRLCAVSVSRAFSDLGCRVWCASHHLLDYLLRHPDLVRGKHVVELGSGTALAALFLARHTAPASLLCTDLPAVLQSMLENIQRNPGLARSVPLHSLVVGGIEHSSRLAPITVGPCDWNRVPALLQHMGDIAADPFPEIAPSDALSPADELRRGDDAKLEAWTVWSLAKADIVIGSDLVYDRDACESLSRLLHALLRPSTSPRMAIFATCLRNPDTFDYFRDQLEENGLEVEELGGRPPESLTLPIDPWSAATPIRLWRITATPRDLGR